MNGPLPPAVRFIERDWLSANSVLLLDPECNILVDTGFLSRADETLALLARPEHLGAQRLHRIVNTHCHCDHVGGNAVLRSAYQCQIVVPESEADLVRNWDRAGLWLEHAHHRGDPFPVDATLAPGDCFLGGGLEWVAVAAPGHDMGALMFHCPQARLLISGDALWEHSLGLIQPDVEGGLAAARATLECIAALDVGTVLPGHGPMFSDIGAALSRAFDRVARFEQDPARMAGHALLAMFGFTLLDRGRLPLVTLPDLLEALPAATRINQQYFRLPPGELAQWLISQMEKAGVAFRQDGWLISGWKR